MKRSSRLLRARRTSRPEAATPSPDTTSVSKVTSNPQTSGPKLSPRMAPLLASVPALLLGAGVAARGVFDLDSAPLPAPTILEPAPVKSEELPRVPLSRTLIVKRERVSGSVVLRGSVEAELARWRSRAGVYGTVARLWVSPGETVRRGQRVAQVSSGEATRPAPRAERQQSRAEQAQIAASQAQDALNQRMLDAQSRLLASQQRVAQAQAKVAQARQVISRLRTQDNAPDDNSSDDAPDDAPEAALPPVDLNTNRERAAKATQNALSERARALQDDAESAARSARAANAEADTLDAQARTAKSRVEAAQDKLKAAQAALDAGTAKGSELEAARGTLEDLKTEAASKTTQVAVARQNAERLSARATTLQRSADVAAQRAAADLKNLRVFSERAPERIRAPKRSQRATSQRASGNTIGSISVAEAARLVRAAVAESDSASAQARRIKREVDTYQQQVTASRQNIANSSQELESAQKQVLATGVRPVLTSVYAPISGRVVRVARLADNVGPDDSVVTVGRDGSLHARLPDRSGIWRVLRPGDSLSALLVPPPQNVPQATPPTPTQPSQTQSTLTQKTGPALLPTPAVAAPSFGMANRGVLALPTPSVPAMAPKASATGSATGSAPNVTTPNVTTPNIAPPNAITPNVPNAAPNIAPNMMTALPNGIAVVVRVSAIEPPATPGAPAIVFADFDMAALQNQTPGRALAPGAVNGALRAALRNGAGVFCSVTRPGARVTMRVPVGALLRGADGQIRVAVMRPIFAPTPTTTPQETTQTEVPNAPLSAPAMTPSATPAATPTPDSTMNDTMNDTMQVEWRVVTLGQSDGVMQEVTGGLQGGERIALEPNAITASAPIAQPISDDGFRRAPAPTRVLLERS